MRFHSDLPRLTGRLVKGKESIQDTRQPEECSDAHHVASLQRFRDRIAPTEAVCHKGGSRSSPRAVSISLTLVPYPFTMRVRSA